MERVEVEAASPPKMGDFLGGGITRELLTTFNWKLYETEMYKGCASGDEHENQKKGMLKNPFSSLEELLFQNTALGGGSVTKVVGTKREKRGKGLSPTGEWYSAHTRAQLRKVAEKKNRQQGKTCSVNISSFSMKAIKALASGRQSHLQMSNRGERMAKEGGHRPRYPREKERPINSP